MEKLKDNFGYSEFLNRIDKVIVFNALTHDNIKEIVTLHIEKLTERIKDKRMTVELTKTGLDYLAKV